MDEQNVKSTPLDEAERLLGVYKVHSEAHKEAMEKGDEEALRNIERAVAHIYFETHLPLLKVAMANISAFSVLRFGLVAPPAMTPEMLTLQKQTVQVLLTAIQDLLPVGYDIVGVAMGRGGREDIEPA
jgi:hypothetical protein